MFSRLVLCCVSGGSCWPPTWPAAAVASAFILYFGHRGRAAFWPRSSSCRTTPRAFPPAWRFSRRSRRVSLSPPSSGLSPRSRATRCCSFVLITWLIAAGRLHPYHRGQRRDVGASPVGRSCCRGRRRSNSSCRCWRGNVAGSGHGNFSPSVAWGQVKAEVEENPAGGNLSCGRGVVLRSRRHTMSAPTHRYRETQQPNAIRGLHRGPSRRRAGLAGAPGALPRLVWPGMSVGRSQSGPGRRSTEIHPTADAWTAAR